MGFLRRIFGGGGKSSNDAVGLYFYVRPKRCDEIVKVRINMNNDLSRADEGGYFVRKVVQATRCPFPAELHVSFDDKRRITQIGVQDGEEVGEEVYNEWISKYAEGEDT